LAGHEISDLVLDDELQRADPARFARLLDEFAEGYRSNFRGDEAESTADWPARIAGQPAPQPLMRIAVAVDGSEKRVLVQRLHGVTCAAPRNVHRGAVGDGQQPRLGVAD
jgi:hypothetical protein